MIGTVVLCDLSRKMAYGALNFIVDPEGWSMIVYAGEDHEGLPLWRLTYPEPPELSESKEATTARAQERIPLFLRCSKDFKITRATPYILN